MFKFMTTVCAFAVLGFVAMPAFADHHKGEGHAAGKEKAPMMKKLDANGDNKISKKEFMALHAKQFEKMDSNDDGFITKEEMKEGRKKMHEEMKEGRKKMHKEMKEGRKKMHKEMKKREEKMKEKAE